MQFLVLIFLLCIGNLGFADNDLKNDEISGAVSYLTKKDYRGTILALNCVAVKNICLAEVELDSDTTTAADNEKKVKMVFQIINNGSYPIANMYKKGDFIQLVPFHPGSNVVIPPLG